jgi:hypothetical protein
VGKKEAKSVVKPWYNNCDPNLWPQETEEPIFPFFSLLNVLPRLSNFFQRRAVGVNKTLLVF